MPGAANMALDEALFARARATGRGCVRVYTWSQPTISLGRNQTARGAWDLERCRARGVAIVRRLTGGRAILHHREITYSVAAPVIEGRGLREDYRAIANLLAAALSRLGITTSSAAPSTRMPIPASAPCFELPARDELVVDGRKLVASAQVRDDGAYLQHGSLLNHDDQGWLGTLAVSPMPVSPAATVAALLGRELTADEVAQALAAAMPEVWREAPRWLHVDACAPEAAPLLPRYEDPAWTFRR